MFFGKVIARVRAFALVGIDTFVMLSTARGKRRPGLVLMVRVDEIGDFVIWLEAAQALIRYYKASGKGVFLVANRTWAAWAKELALFEDVFAVDVPKFKQELMYRYRVGRLVRKLGCALAIEPSYTHKWLVGDSIIRVSGARVRIGFFEDGSALPKEQRYVADHWYTQLIAADPQPSMELERNAEFVRKLTNADFEPNLVDLRKLIALRLDDSFHSAVSGNNYYVLFPGATWEGKQWSISNFVELAEKLYRRTGWQGVVCGGPSDIELAGDLCGRSAVPLLNWAGRTDLPQLASILAASKLVVTNDTSAVHIAAACGTPAVCVLGGGHYGRFLPYETRLANDRPLPRTVSHFMSCFGCNWQCIYDRAPGAAVPCIDQITVSQVWQAIADNLV